MRRLQLGPAAIWLVAMAFGPAAAAESLHPPASAAEKALDAILKRADRDSAQLDNLLQGRGDRAFRQTVDYTAMLTSPLIAAIRAEEKAAVQRDCGGHYTEGEICGLDYSPITCGQDSGPTYVYRTEIDQGDEARIAYAPGKGEKPAATYRLVRQAGQWKIDGISCDTGARFNFAGK